MFNSQTHNKKFKLFIMGPYYRPNDETMLNEAIRKFDLKDDVLLVGTMFGKTKASYVLACDVFCYTSRFEGLPMAPLEAMALGRPCLVTPGSNVADIVARAGGWTCNEDSKSIYDALQEIDKQSDSLKDRGNKAMRLMLQEFTWDKVAIKLKSEQEQILSNFNND